jgi:hypothetical protein
MTTKLPTYLSTLIVSGVLGALLLPGAALADTEGNSNASCMGHEASWASPPGTQTTTYAQFGMPGILDFVDEVVIPAFELKNRGEAISGGPAQVNKAAGHTLDTHEACDDALGIPEGAE